MRSIFALCCLFLFAIMTTVAQNKPVDFAELEKTVAAELKENNTPGAAIVVISGDRILFIKGFGTTSVEGGASITPDTLFRMGSTTKMFTEMRRYVGKFSHEPQTWEVFVRENKLHVKEDGKDFPLTKMGRDKFTYEQGELIFLSNERGEVEHLSLGLYAARKVMP